VEEYLVCNLKVVLPVLKFFPKTPLENSGGAENSAEISGTNGINFFAICTNSLRHLVWVPEINVKPCNSVQTYLLTGREMYRQAEMLQK
jgi:hypothetical protein